ncbi:hypothetical protein QOZ80_6BG0480150 [Eleusine coracana subsp. coracana]|nr:hypothetical protein QOZ80_6BG0480150 [Eleusine coracana subsp. coracana]
MGLSSAVDWWEESQLRVLVLSSLIIQWLLFVSSISRRFAIPRWFRPIIWLAYLGSDAVAIYGLATLFNRHKNQDRGGSSILEVVWAPVFLIHLGGQDGITAYNMEDNELWTRHVVTAVSQITVAIYVFIKSWKQDGDKKLLQAAIVLFFIGTIKCLEKPWALKSASIHSLVSSSDRAQRRANRAAAGTDPLEDYVQKAKELVQNRPNLFKSANNELKDILEQNKRASMERGLKQIPRSIRNLLETVYGKLKGSLKPRPISVRKLVTAVLEKVKGILKRDNPQVEEERHMKTLLSLMSIEGQGKEGLIRDAWVLAQELQALGNEKEVWDVIQGVWVEMLCFSAGRCRGYLHAKALGTGGEFLSYVWLLMSHMGMETLTERLQREEIPVPVPVPGEGGNTSAAPSTSKSPTSVPAPPVPEDRTSAAAPSTSEVVVVVPTDAAAPSEVPSSTAPSISEIHAVPEDDMV